MLQIRHLTITHRQDLRPLLEDFSFSLRPGDRAAVIGEEGNGKSTLLKLIADESLVAGYAAYTGEILRDGMRPGYLSQELTGAERASSVYAFCLQEPAFLDREPRELSEIAAALGLPPALLYDDRPVSTLSGGEQVKLRLARLLAARPDFLLLDEPSNDLDLDTLAWLEAYLLACPLPVLYISHDETLLERTANVVIHLELLRRKTVPRATVARMPYRQYVDQRLSLQARQEQMARKEKADQEKQMEKYRRIYQRVEHEQNVISRQDPGGARLLKKKMKAVKSMGRRFERQAEDATPMPEAEEAIFACFPESAALPAGKPVIDYSLEVLRMGDRVLAEGIRLTVTGPEKIGITGQNGVGKTTLLRALAAELLARPELKAAYMPQNYEEGLTMARTPVELLSAVGDREEQTRIRTLLGSLKYTPEEMEHPAGALSGGQKAKLYFVKMILAGSRVLLLDEPTRNFSPLSNPVIRQVLREYRGAVISVSHDRKFLEEVCDRVYRLTPEGLRRTR